MMRIDQLLVERGLASIPLAGPAPDWRPACAGLTAQWRPSPRTATTCPTAQIELLDAAEARYVSRGGLKLEGALQAPAWLCGRPGTAWTWASPPAASPTACCSRARRMWWGSTWATASCMRLRQDPRVSPAWKRVNARESELARVPGGAIGEQFDLMTGDLSFISQTLVLPALVPLLKPGGRAADAGQAAVRAAARARLARAASCKDAACTRWSSSASATPAPRWACVSWLV
jgi:23S rRNA (cytidine1920-2'-O)/16S rRNA (cytidine1409-2'-O)-methyltransferase